MAPGCASKGRFSGRQSSQGESGEQQVRSHRRRLRPSWHWPRCPTRHRRATRSGSSAPRRSIRSRRRWPSSSASRARGKTPVVESTGTGGGMKLFCAGVGAAHPDLTNASRAMKKGEFDDCQKNGVKDIVEIKVGIDGLTIAQSKAGPAHEAHHGAGLPGAGRAGARQGRQARRQSQQDLVGRRQVAAERQDRGARPAADLRHARLLPRAVHGSRCQARSRRSQTLQEVRSQGLRQGSGSRSARTAPTSRPARTTTSSCRSSRPTRTPSASSATPSSRRTPPS